MSEGGREGGTALSVCAGTQGTKPLFGQRCPRLGGNAIGRARTKGCAKLGVLQLPHSLRRLHRGLELDVVAVGVRSRPRLERHSHLPLVARLHAHAAAVQRHDAPDQQHLAPHEAGQQLAVHARQGRTQVAHGLLLSGCCEWRGATPVRASVSGGLKRAWRWSCAVTRQLPRHRVTQRVPSTPPYQWCVRVASRFGSEPDTGCVNAAGAPASVAARLPLAGSTAVVCPASHAPSRALQAICSSPVASRRSCAAACAGRLA